MCINLRYGFCLSALGTIASTIVHFFVFLFIYSTVNTFSARMPEPIPNSDAPGDRHAGRKCGGVKSDRLSPLSAVPSPPFHYVAFYDSSDENNSQEGQISLISGAEQSSSSSPSLMSTRRNQSKLPNEGWRRETKGTPSQFSGLQNYASQVGAVLKESLRKSRRWWSGQSRRAPKSSNRMQNEAGGVSSDFTRDAGGGGWDASSLDIPDSRQKENGPTADTSLSAVSASMHSSVSEMGDKERVEEFNDEFGNISERDTYGYKSSFFRKMPQHDGKRAPSRQGTCFVGGDEGKDSETERMEGDFRDDDWMGEKTSAERRMQRMIAYGDAYPGSVSSDDEDEENAEEVDLVETIYQYKLSQQQFHLNIIQQKLIHQSVKVDGALLSVAEGCPPVFQALLDHGEVDLTDPSVPVKVQHEIDLILSGNPFEGDLIRSSDLDYLRTLCRIPSSRISLQQMVLLRYSGFLFIEILMDFPHLEDVEEIKLNNSCRMKLCRLGLSCFRFYNFFSLIPTLLLNPSIFLTCVYWIVKDNKLNGYWSFLCYFVGFVAGVISTIRSERHKQEQYSRMNKRMYFPDHNYVMFPLINLYKLNLWLRIVHYEHLPNRAHYCIIRHDLLRAHSIQQISEGLYSAIPQLVLQLFFFSSHDVDLEITGRACKILLLTIASFSALCGVGCYTVFTVYSHSCDSFGFAVLLVDEFYRENEYKVGTTSIPSLITDVLTRTINFFSIVFCVTLLVTSLVELSLTNTCEEKEVAYKVLMGLCFATAGLTLLAFSLVVSICRFSRFSALLAVPVLVLFIVFLVLSGTFFSGIDNCGLNHFWSFSWHIPCMVFFVLALVLMIFWAGLVSVELCRKKRITQRSVDYCLWKSR